MKKHFIKIAEFIQSLFDKYAIKRFQELMPKGLIIELYRKDKNLETVYNLGRHYGQEPKLRTA